MEAQLLMKIKKEVEDFQVLKDLKDVGLAYESCQSKSSAIILFNGGKGKRGHSYTEKA